MPNGLQANLGPASQSGYHGDGALRVVAFSEFLWPHPRAISRRGRPGITEHNCGFVHS